MSKKFLNIQFGDNDFQATIKAVGDFILDNFTPSHLHQLEKKNRLHEVVVFLCGQLEPLYQQNWTLFIDDIGDGEKISTKRYEGIFDSISVELSKYPFQDYESSVSLVVDYYADECYMSTC